MAWIASSATLTTVGNAMMPRIMDTFSALVPLLTVIAPSDKPSFQRPQKATDPSPAINVQRAQERLAVEIRSVSRSLTTTMARMATGVPMNQPAT